MTLSLPLHATLKIPADAVPLATGVSLTVQEIPLSGERNTRAAGPPVPKYMTSLPHKAMDVPLAAKAPSCGSAGGILSRGNSFQCSPSSVLNTRNLPSTGSLSATQCVFESQARESRKKPARLSEYCSFQLFPPSMVL